jgi:fatty-acyl-CoA synthase
VSPDIEVRVVDPADGEPLADGLEGELQFRGPNVVDAYLGNPGAAADAFTGDGWFASGDLGLLVADGGFVHTCRMGDALRLRGFLVDPSEIELRLGEHPAVRTAKVVGVPGPDGGTRAVGFVVLEPGPAAGPTPAQLRDWCAGALARFKVPDEVRVIGEMPTTSGTNGTKIRAATLREWAQGSPTGAPGPSSR